MSRDRIVQYHLPLDATRVDFGVPRLPVDLRNEYAFTQPLDMEASIPAPTGRRSRIAGRWATMREAVGRQLGLDKLRRNVALLAGGAALAGAAMVAVGTVEVDHDLNVGRSDVPAAELVVEGLDLGAGGAVVLAGDFTASSWSRRIDSKVPARATNGYANAGEPSAIPVETSAVAVVQPVGPADLFLTPGFMER